MGDKNTQCEERMPNGCSGTGLDKCVSSKHQAFTSQCPLSTKQSGQLLSKKKKNVLGLIINL